MSELEPPKPKKMWIKCFACALDVEIQPDDYEIRCPQCRRRYRLLTRFVVQAHGRRGPQGDVHYEIVTREEGGRSRPRQITLPSLEVRVEPQAWQTFVWRGERLVGIANQMLPRWFAVAYKPKPPSKWLTLYRTLLTVAGLMAVLYAVRVLATGAHEIRTRPSFLAALIVLAILAAAPALAWAGETLSWRKQDTFWNS